MPHPFFCPMCKIPITQPTKFTNWKCPQCNTMFEAHADGLTPYYYPQVPNGVEQDYIGNNQWTTDHWPTDPIPVVPHTVTESSVKPIFVEKEIHTCRQCTHEGYIEYDYPKHVVFRCPKCCFTWEVEKPLEIGKYLGYDTGQILYHCYRTIDRILERKVINN